MISVTVTCTFIRNSVNPIPLPYPFDLRPFTFISQNFTPLSSLDTV